ncbi:MAG: hypothetical protein IPM86_11875 [Saprospiraceae bacterium]|nr:hypothetical protein [Saprospiraceae bacterium]
MKNRILSRQLWLFLLLLTSSRMFAQVVNFPQVPMPPGLPAGQVGLHQYLISSADVINSQIVSVSKSNLIQAITNGNLSTLLPGDGSPMSWITLHFDYTSKRIMNTLD